MNDRVNQEVAKQVEKIGQNLGPRRAKPLVTEAMLQAAADATGCPASGRVGPRNREFFTQIYLAMHAASAMSTGTAKTPQAVEGRSPASAVPQADAQTQSETSHDLD